jgi:hypothetical protein
MAKDRDAYELEKSSAAAAVLAMVLRKEIYTWSGTPISKRHDQPLSREHQSAYRLLANAGLVVGDVITGRGYRAAQDWELIK